MKRRIRKKERKGKKKEEGEKGGEGKNTKEVFCILIDYKYKKEFINCIKREKNL